MADLPANTMAVVENNSSALNDIAQSSITHMTFGVNLMPLSWILLAEVLVLGIVGSIFAIRLVQRRKKQMINAVSQMIGQYSREKNTRMALNQKMLEEQFQLSPEKAAQASRQLQENELSFLSTLTRALTFWDMQRLSRIHLELKQINDEQFSTLASAAQELALQYTTQQDATKDNDDGIHTRNPDLSHEEIDLFFANEKEEITMTETQPSRSAKAGPLLFDDNIGDELVKIGDKDKADSELVFDLPGEEQADSRKL
jgi:hypothetical protein